MTGQHTINLKAFRKANKITQADLAKILGVGRSFIGLIECGSSKLPDVYLQSLLANENLDTSMLVIQDNKNTESGNSNSELELENKLLKAEIEALKARLVEVQADKEKCWELINKLMK